MPRRPTIYGLDIETDTSIDGLDPRVARILTVALSTPAGDRVFAGSETELLLLLDEHLAQLPPGVIATWNGGAFDLPFLADRADRCGVKLGLRTVADTSITLRGRPLPGHAHVYRGDWYHHRHLDAYRLYRADVGRLLRVSCSLKSIARVVGLAPVEVDRERIHDLEKEMLHAYATSDARLARALAERRWASVARNADRLPHGATSPPELTSRPSATRRPRVRLPVAHPALNHAS